MTYDESCEDRKRTAPTTSSGLPTRPCGVLLSTYSRFASSRSQASFKSVRMYPGPTAFTRTSGAHRAASPRVSYTSAAFDAWYTTGARVTT